MVYLICWNLHFSVELLGGVSFCNTTWVRVTCSLELDIVALNSDVADEHLVIV